MLEADDLTAAVKKAEAELAAEQKAVDADRKAMAAEHAELQASLERIAARARRRSSPRSTSSVLAIFEQVVASAATASRVAEARDGICTICHVRLRPQVFNTVRRNERDHPVRQLQPHPVLRARRRPRPPAAQPSRPLQARRAEVVVVHRRRRARQSRAGRLRRAHRAARRHAGRGVRRIDRRRHQQRRRVPRRCIAALEWAQRARPPRSCTSDRIRCCSSSRCCGNYKVKNPGLQPLHAKARLLAHEIGRVTFEHVGRAPERARRSAGERGDGCVAAGTAGPKPRWRFDTWPPAPGLATAELSNPLHADSERAVRSLRLRPLRRRPTKAPDLATHRRGGRANAAMRRDVRA